MKQEDVVKIIGPWQGVGTRGPRGGEGPPCPQCGVSSWIELAGGPSDDAYHPNIDKRNIPNVDIHHNLESGIPVHDSHAEYLKMVDVFNYFTPDGADELLIECFRVLRPGGSFYLRTVDLPWVCRRIVEDGLVAPWLHALYHAPDTAYGPLGEGIHRWGYSYDSLKEKLELAGFVNTTHHGYYNRWEMKVEAWKPTTGKYSQPQHSPGRIL